jgi:hypothetical protein
MRGRVVAASFLLIGTGWRGRERYCDSEAFEMPKQFGDFTMSYQSISFPLVPTAALFSLLLVCGCQMSEHPGFTATQPAAKLQQTQGAFMSSIHLVRDYAYPPETVWRILTEPAFMARWALNSRPEGFSTAVGTRFRLIGKPQIGWSGVIGCRGKRALCTPLFLGG